MLSTTYELALRHKSATNRELYYLHAAFFGSQQETNAAVEHAGLTMQLARHELGIFAASRGYFAGSVYEVDAHDNDVLSSVLHQSGHPSVAALHVARSIPASELAKLAVSLLRQC